DTRIEVSVSLDMSSGITSGYSYTIGAAVSFGAASALESIASEYQTQLEVSFGNSSGLVAELQRSELFESVSLALGSDFEVLGVGTGIELSTGFAFGSDMDTSCILTVFGEGVFRHRTGFFGFWGSPALEKTV